MFLSSKPIGLGRTLALAISLCSMGSGAVLAQTELKVIEEALPMLQPIPVPSFAEMQPGTSDSKYARCSDATPLIGESSQKQLQVYINITARRAQCVEEGTYGSAPLYDEGLVDLYQGKYSELNAVIIESQQILDAEKPVSKKRLIDYANYVNEEITLLMVLSAYAECKALEANSLAMKVDPKCDTERLQEMIVSRNHEGQSQHAHTQSLFKQLVLEPFRELPVIDGPQELISVVTARQYKPIGTGAEVLEIVILEKREHSFLLKEQVNQYGAYLIAEVSFSSEPEPEDLRVQVSLNIADSTPVTKTLILSFPIDGPHYLSGDFVVQSSPFTLWPQGLTPLPSPVAGVSP